MSDPGYATVSDVTTETLTRYLSPARIRIGRSTGYVTEVTAENRGNEGSRSAHPFGDLGMRDPLPQHNFLQALERACWNCHSLASAAESPMATASSSGVLQTIGLSLGIAEGLMLR
jgi:hypothetical protein